MNADRVRAPSLAVTIALLVVFIASPAPAHAGREGANPAGCPSFVGSNPEPPMPILSQPEMIGDLSAAGISPDPVICLFLISGFFLYLLPREPLVRSPSPQPVPRRLPGTLL